MFLDLGLLFLRATVGGFMLSHGWVKLSNYSAMSAMFPDPLGIGAQTTLFLAIFSEFFCALLVVIGLSTRLATVPILVTMLTAAFIVHAPDPWAKKELALLFASCFATILMTGPGAFSVDGFYRMRKSSRP